MDGSKVFLLLIGVCCLTLLGRTNAECCSSLEEVTYAMDRGDCEELGGKGVDVCRVTICADGVARQGSYCGKGSCNVFGCNCDGGCLTGEWSESFKERYSYYGVKIIEAKRYDF